MGVAVGELSTFPEKGEVTNETGGVATSGCGGGVGCWGATTGFVKGCLPTIIAGNFLAGAFLAESLAIRMAFAAGFFLEAGFFFATGFFFASGLFFDFGDANFFLGADAFFLATTVPFHQSETGITESGNIYLVMKSVLTHRRELIRLRQVIQRLK